MKCACPDNRQLRHRVSLQRLRADAPRNSHNEVDVQDDANWQTLGTVWAAFTTRGGAERFASDQLQAGQSHVVHMRRTALTAGLTPQDRLRMGARTFWLSATYDENEERRWIVAHCTEAK